MMENLVLETVLLVDADALQRSLVGEYLRDCGYRVIEATNADEAITILESEPVDVVVTDVNLRGVSGFELSVRAREAAPGVSVILTHSPERTARIASELCEDGPLDHPYHPQQLIDRIKRLRGR